MAAYVRPPGRARCQGPGGSTSPGPLFCGSIEANPTRLALLADLPFQGNDARYCCGLLHTCLHTSCCVVQLSAHAEAPAALVVPPGIVVVLVLVGPTITHAF